MVWQLGRKRRLRLCQVAPSLIRLSMISKRNSLTLRLSAYRPKNSRDNLMNHFPMYISQVEIATTETKSERLMIQT